MHGPMELDDSHEERAASSDRLPLDARAVEVLSHELRSPITTIHLGTKVLRSGEMRPPVRAAVLEAVDLEADRLVRVVEDLLAVVRFTSGAKLRVEPLLLQRRLAQLLGEGADLGDVRVRVFLPDDLPAVLADDAALGQVVRNLLLNAGRHGSSTHPTEVTATAEPPGWVTLRVLDRGPGIDPENAERIFEPFFRSGPESGAGLGLAAALRLAEAMGGTLTASPRDGGGSVFAVGLRVATPEV